MCLRLSSNYTAVIGRTEMSLIEKLKIVSICFKVRRGGQIKKYLLYMGKACIKL